MKTRNAALLTTALTVLLGAGLAGNAEAQSKPIYSLVYYGGGLVGGSPSGPTGGAPPISALVAPAKPTTPPTIPTTPPVSTVPTPPPVITTPTPPPPVVIDLPKPTPPQGMFNNIPADMRTMTGLAAVSSIDRLLTQPARIDLTLPRQAVPNRLENSPAVSSPSAGMPAAEAGLDAMQLMDNAKPLI